MLGIDEIDWRLLLLPDTPVLEIVLRGSVMYWGLFLLLRFVHKRQSTSLSTSDVLMIVQRADAAQARRGGQADAVGQLDIGDSPLVLELTQQAPVDIVEIGHSHSPC